MNVTADVFTPPVTYTDQSVNSYHFAAVIKVKGTLSLIVPLVFIYPAGVCVYGRCQNPTRSPRWHESIYACSSLFGASFPSTSSENECIR